MISLSKLNDLGEAAEYERGSLELSMPRLLEMVNSIILLINKFVYPVKQHNLRRSVDSFA